MRVVDLETIEALATRDALTASVRSALIAYAAGEISSAPPGHLGFEDPPGDCLASPFWATRHRQAAKKLFIWQDVDDRRHFRRLQIRARRSILHTKARR
jgi:ornithine cyclodeaminase/alanine dehydrogenase-like protein (mu-crystallin family)